MYLSLHGVSILLTIQPVDQYQLAPLHDVMIPRHVQKSETQVYVPENSIFEYQYVGFNYKVNTS